ncbi:energy transducer TonB [Pseudoalteromonas sp. SSDWG2]|uniref:energy transducer TonB n=1 Tax=Pseudoalteromonas sp. SSDWG2 TaxID=3139391 RepID=UPI003BA9C5A6
MIKNCIIRVLAALVIYTTPSFALEVVDTKLARSWPIKPSDTTDGSRQESWANVSYVVNTQGKIEQIEVLSHSDVVFDSDYLARLLQAREYEPAYIDNKPVPSAKNDIVFMEKLFNGFDNDTIKRGFMRLAHEFSDAITRKDMDSAQQKLAELREYTKNNTEQALSHWYNSQYYFFKQDWQQYQHHLLSAFALQKKLPTEFRIDLLQNTVSWFMYTHEYANALGAIDAYRSLVDVNMDAAVVKEAMAQVVSTLEQHSHITYQYTMAPSEARLVAMSRERTVISTQAPLSKAQLRCNYAVIDIPMNEQGEYDITQLSSRGQCAFLLRSDIRQKVKIVQSGHSHLL